MPGQWWPSVFDGLDAAAAAFWSVAGSGISGNATEVSSASVISESGQFLAFKVSLSAAPGAGKSWQFQVSINGTPSALDFTISDAATTGSDTGTVAVAAGDLVTIKVTPSGTPAAANMVGWINFSPTTANNFCYPAGHGSSQLSAAPRYSTGLYSGLPQTTDTGLTRNIIPFAATLTKVFISLATAPGGVTSWDFSMYVNGVKDATTVIQIAGVAKTGNLTGLSVALAAGDILSFVVDTKNGLAANTRGVTVCCTIAPSTAGLFALTAPSTAGANVSATNYTQPHDAYNAGWSATEADEQFVAPGPINLETIAARITTVAGVGNMWTYNSRVGGSNGNLSVVISGAAELVDSSATGVDEVAEGGLVSVAVTPDSTPTGMGANYIALGVQIPEGRKGGGGRPFPKPPKGGNGGGFDHWPFSIGHESEYIY
jgi:hypothetical protein